MDNLIIFGAKYLVFIVPLIVIWLWHKQSKDRKAELALAVAIAGLLALAFVLIAGKLYFNARPFAVEHIQPLVNHAKDNGFPSEHTVFAMTLTAVIYFYHRKLAAGALAITLLVGTSRVLADVHHGIDIIAGLAIGITAAAAGHWLVIKILKPPAAVPKDQDLPSQPQNG